MSSIERCVTHLFERADRFCGHCGANYCDDCLVQPFPKKPPLCKACALEAAGIRSTAGRMPTRSRKEIKAAHRALSDEMSRSDTPTTPAQAAAHADAQAPRRLRFAIAQVEVARLGAPDVVPPQLSETLVPARTKRLWRTTG